MDKFMRAAIVEAEKGRDSGRKPPEHLNSFLMGRNTLKHSV